MNNKFVLSVFLFILHSFSLFAQVKIWGASPKEGAYCSGGVWSMQVTDSTTFNNFINFSPSLNTILPIENSYNRNTIQDGNYFYFISDYKSCSKQSQLIRIDINGKNITLIKIFDTKINSLFRGDDKYLYGVSYDDKKLLKITKNDGSTSNIFTFENPSFSTNILVKNDLLFVSDKDKIYQLKNDGTQKVLIIDDIEVQKQTNNFYNNINLQNAAFDDINIYISLTGNIPPNIIVIPFLNAKNYKIQKINGYDYLEPSKTISLDGYLYFIASKNFKGKSFLKSDINFKAITEIVVPSNTSVSGLNIINQNSKKIIVNSFDDFLIFDTEKSIFLKDLSQNSYNFSFLSNNKYNNSYFKCDFTNSINFINYNQIGSFDLSTQLPQKIVAFEEGKYPEQIIDTFGSKMLVLNKKNQNDYVSKINLLSGVVEKELLLPTWYRNNILAIDSVQYLYTNPENSYVFTIDSVFRKITVPTNIRLDSLYKIKNKIYTSGNDGIYVFNDNTFKKFKTLNNSYENSLFEGDDDYIYICQSLLDGKTFSFFKIKSDGSDFIDLGVRMTNTNSYRINPQCIKVGNYIYGTHLGSLFRINLQSKEYTKLQSEVSFFDIQYSIQDKKIYGLSRFGTFDKEKYNIILIDQDKFSYLSIKSISKTKKILVHPTF